MSKHNEKCFKPSVNTAADCQAVRKPEIINEEFEKAVQDMIKGKNFKK